MKKFIGKIAFYLYRIFKRIDIALNHCYYKTVFDGFDKNMYIFGKIECVGSDKIKFGYNCSLNEGVFLHGGGGIEIANNVTISAGAKVISWQYDLHNWIKLCESKKAIKEHVDKKIYIGDHAWICANAIILPGVRISGRGVIIGAGTILNKDINDDYVLVAGNPGKIVKRYK